MIKTQGLPLVPEIGLPRSEELEDGVAVVGAALSSSYAEVHADRLKLWQAVEKSVGQSGKSVVETIDINSLGNSRTF